MGVDLFLDYHDNNEQELHKLKQFLRSLEEELPKRMPTLDQFGTFNEYQRAYQLWTIGERIRLKLK